MKNGAQHFEISPDLIAEWWFEGWMAAAEARQRAGWEPADEPGLWWVALPGQQLSVRCAAAVEYRLGPHGRLWTGVNAWSLPGRELARAEHDPGG